MIGKFVFYELGEAIGLVKWRGVMDGYFVLDVVTEAWDKTITKGYQC